MLRRPLLYAAIWTVLVGTGLVLMQGYMSTPGTAQAAPMTLPTDVKVPHEAGQPHVVVFVHRGCPCSRSTLNQLAAVQQGGIQRTIVFVGREGKDTRNGRDLESLAQRIGDRVMQDPSGSLAERFGAQTSGHVVAFDEKGELAYAGGLTPGRGMVGPAGGVIALHDILAGQAPEHDVLPVFGCPLTPTSKQKEPIDPGEGDALPACCQQAPSDDDPATARKEELSR